MKSEKLLYAGEGDPQILLKRGFHSFHNSGGAAFLSSSGEDS